MDLYVYVRMDLCKYMYVWTCTYMYRMDLCKYMYVWTYVRIRMYVCTYCTYGLV